MSENYDFYWNRMSGLLKTLKNWKNLRTGSEFVGLAIAFGVYLMTPSFWAFFAVAVVVGGVYFVFQYFERKSFRSIQADYSLVTQPDVFETLNQEEQAELERLFESAKKEMKLK